MKAETAAILHLWEKQGSHLKAILYNFTVYPEFMDSISYAFLRGTKLVVPIVLAWLAVWLSKDEWNKRRKTNFEAITQID